jgi:putative transposase
MGIRPDCHHLTMSSPGTPGELTGQRPDGKTDKLNQNINGAETALTYCRVVDNPRKTTDYMLSERRNKAAARRFFKRAIGTNGVPNRVVIDKSGANLAGLQSVNVILKFTGSGNTIKIQQVKYLNNIIAS